MKKLLLLAAVTVTAVAAFTPAPAVAHGPCITAAAFVYLSGDGIEGAAQGEIDCDVNHPELHLIIEFQRRNGPGDPWNVLDHQPYECANTNFCFRRVLPSHVLCIGKQYRAHVEGWAWSPSDGNHQREINNSPAIDGGHHC